MVGIGLIGCGRISRKYLGDLDGSRVVAVTDLDQEVALSVANQISGCSVARDVRELLEWDDVDLVVIATPSGTHAELGIRAALTGKHVLVEKPIDVDPSKARQLIDTCHDAGVVLSVVSQHRFDPVAIAAKERIDQGLPVALAAGEVWWHRDAGYYSGWRGTRDLDGGVLMQQGIHTVDLMLWLLGPVESIAAYAATVAHEMEMEDVLVAALRFQRGTLATLSVTTASHPQSAESLSLTGPVGTIVVTSPPDEGQAHRAQLRDVIEAIETGRRPLVTGEDGLAALELVTTAYESAEDLS